MVFLQWRKFNFFNLKKGVDDGVLANLFKDSEIVATSSGNNQLVIGDSLGQIHSITAKWEVTTFRAYEIRVLLMQQMRNAPLLVTIGEDEKGVNPVIKVWDMSRYDKNGMPYCSRITRAVPNNRAVQVSTLCVHKNLQYMAVGFVDGSLLLYRGDVARDRGFRQKLLREASSAVTGLAFKSSANSVYLFVATDNSVYAYNITTKDKEVMSQIDNTGGCALNCSVLAELVQESHFFLARNDAIYCYTTDAKGPCYVLDGEKVMLQWFRSYLVIISKTTRVTPTQTKPPTPTQTQPSNTHQITLLDIQNKYIVFSSMLSEIKAIVNEWGGLYIVDRDNTVYNLNEKDVQSKLALLFKRNMYDIAIRIAKSQQYDSDGLVDIFRQYGDHLYSTGDYSGAMEQYVKTIGKLEPSYVIRKFMDSKHIDKLTHYLQEVHIQRQASEDHTTLLLNCFTKQNQTDKLKEFILQKDRELNFDVDIAIKVCRQGSPQEALMLAKSHEKHDWYIKLLLEDHLKYSEAIDYIASLDAVDAEHYMKKYGKVLVENAPSESTQFLKRLCTTACGVYGERANPEDYIHLFLQNSSRLVEFLEHLTEAGRHLSSRVYDTLLEHYLHVWSSLDDGQEKMGYANRTLRLLQNAEIDYDKQQALVVCHMHGFSAGILYLYEEQTLYPQILRYHMSRKDKNAVLACCKRFDLPEPTLWVQALWSCIRDSDDTMQEILPEILKEIAERRLLSPQQVIEEIGTGKAQITLAQTYAYIENEFKKDLEKTTRNGQQTEKYLKDNEALKEKLENLKTKPVVFQGSRCSACNRTLELPSVHFLCQHSYHKHCLQSYSDNENECVACHDPNREILEKLKPREYKKNLNDDFHSQLDKAPDPFELTAEFFRRRVFNTIKVITDSPAVEQKPKEEPPAKIEVRKPTYGLGAEARLRQEENKRSAPTLIPMSEGRLRVQEARVGGSVESTRMLSKSVESSKSVRSFKKVEPKPSEITYPETLNPFSNEPVSAKDEDDYNKNLDPFYEGSD